MLYFALKTVEYFWKTEKQSKNVQRIIDLANKVSAQSVEIYDSAQSAHDSVEKSMEKLEAVMSKIKDGRGSLLSRILKMIKVGGLSPKKEIPKNVKEEVDENEEVLNKVINVPEFTSVDELSKIMDVKVQDVETFYYDTGSRVYPLK